MVDRNDSSHAPTGDSVEEDLKAACLELEASRREIQRWEELEDQRASFVEELGVQIQALRRQREELSSELRSMKDAYEGVAEDLARQQARVDALYASETWRAGKAALWLPKKIRRRFARKP